MKTEKILNRQMDKALKFIDNYKTSKNAATGSAFDSNANVVCKNVSTLSCELGKESLIQLNYRITYEYLKKMYGEEIAKQFITDENSHIIYPHDSSSILPYCAAISLYPYLLNGLKDLGGSSGVPQHANGFIGGLINLVYQVASQFAGAVAIPEFLTYFDHFLRKDFGDDYTQHLEDVVERSDIYCRTLKQKIEDWFQQFVYSINQPAGARNYQSPFTNIAYFDKYYFESIFRDFVFPDGDEPKWESTRELQKIFMNWFNEERTKEVLTFPVETFNLLVDKETGKYLDEETADFVAEMHSKGHSFFIYQSDSADALSSCCRLKNTIEDNTFSYTLGAGGIQTGSKKVITLNLNRIVQDWYRIKEETKQTLPEYLTPIIERVHKYLEAWNQWLHDLYDANLLPVYKAGFIDLDRQYLTIGVNGFVEAAEFLGIEISPECEDYKKLASEVLDTIEKINRKNRTEHHKANLEFVPGENCAVKLYQWDKEDDYVVPETRNCYNSYFYVVEDTTVSSIKKFYYQGAGFADKCSGGVALHNNLSEHLSKAQYRHLMDVAVKAGCNYWTYNIPNTICNECGHIDKRMLNECPECHSKNVDYATRIIGYLKRVSNFSAARQEEANRRYYANDKD